MRHGRRSGGCADLPFQRSRIIRSAPSGCGSQTTTKSVVQVRSCPSGPREVRCERHTWYSHRDAKSLIRNVFGFRINGGEMWASRPGKPPDDPALVLQMTSRRAIDRPDMSSHCPGAQPYRFLQASEPCSHPARFRRHDAPQGPRCGRGNWDRRLPSAPRRSRRLGASAAPAPAHSHCNRRSHRASRT